MSILCLPINLDSQYTLCIQSTYIIYVCVLPTYARWMMTLHYVTWSHEKYEKTQFQRMKKQPRMRLRRMALKAPMNFGMCFICTALMEYF